jgi:hypothetical protein
VKYCLAVINKFKNNRQGWNCVIFVSHCDLCALHFFLYIWEFVLTYVPTFDLPLLNLVIWWQNTWEVPCEADFCYILSSVYRSHGQHWLTQTSHSKQTTDEWRHLGEKKLNIIDHMDSIDWHKLLTASRRQTSGDI